MNYRIAKKIATCNSSLCHSYQKMVTAKEVIIASGKPGWHWVPCTEEEFNEMQERFDEYSKLTKTKT